MLVKMEDAVAGEMFLPGATIKLSKTPARVGPVPTPGQHTDEVLGGLLGYERDGHRLIAKHRRHRLTPAIAVHSHMRASRFGLPWRPPVILLPGLVDVRADS